MKTENVEAHNNAHQIPLGSGLRRVKEKLKSGSKAMETGANGIKAGLSQLLQLASCFLSCPRYLCCTDWNSIIKFQVLR